MKEFTPVFNITNPIFDAIRRIEKCCDQVHTLPLTPHVIASLRESAKLYNTHYSTMIEGNRLDAAQVKEVIHLDGHFPGRIRDEHEVKGYYAALDKMEEYASHYDHVTEKMIQTLHALAMSDGRSRVKATPYRDGQNVIRDSKSGGIVYLPPEAKDVPKLMKSFVIWLQKEQKEPTYSIAIVAAIAHYQFATIHPYYDGNGRTARLLTTLILHMGGYDLKGLYSLEEYYAKTLAEYYNSISIGPSHNYYEGRETSDITPWIDYFCTGMAVAFEKVIIQMETAKMMNTDDKTSTLRKLDTKKRRCLVLFKEYEQVTSKQIASLFDISVQSGQKLCQKWTKEGFICIANESRKTRTYTLHEKWHKLLF